MPAQTIFLCYRTKDDSSGTAAICDVLVEEFGIDAVFKDENSVPPGENFEEFIEARVQECLVVVVVIGRAWLEATDEDGRRCLSKRSDWVRTEMKCPLANAL